MVEIAGYAGEEWRSETWCVFSGNGGERIPSIPAAIAANMVLRRAIRGAGIVPLPDWITRDQLVAELAARDIRLAVRSGAGEWRAVGDATNC
jgi:hypothetical protein